MNEKKEFEWIENFFLDKLSQEEKKIFQEKVESDKDFKIKVEEFKKTYSYLNDMHLEKIIKNKIVTLQKRDRKKFFYIKRLKMAFTSISVAASIFFVYLSTSEISFPNAENDFNITRGLDTSSYTIEQKYAFSTFFDGQAHLTDGLYLIAVNDFEKSLKVSTVRPYFREAAQWHLAVAYLKSGQPIKAEKIYNQLNNCSDCEYPISNLNKWKLWLKIQIFKFL